MAQRDRSQGFAFVYGDISKILRESRKQDAVVTSQGGSTSHFNAIDKARLTQPTSDLPSPEVAKAKATREKAVKQIKENLDRLQVLHHKLHAMLEELNKISGSKKNEE